MKAITFSEYGTAEVLRLAEVVPAFAERAGRGGQAEAVINKRYPLEQTADAVRYVEQGYASGKVVVVI